MMTTFVHTKLLIASTLLLTACGQTNDSSSVNHSDNGRQDVSVDLVQTSDEGLQVILRTKDFFPTLTFRWPDGVDDWSDEALLLPYTTDGIRKPADFLEDYELEIRSGDCEVLVGSAQLVRLETYDKSDADTGVSTLEVTFEFECLEAGREFTIDGRAFYKEPAP